MNFRPIVILTGAGVSAESGLPTFRSGDDALWEGQRWEKVATPQAFREQPESVHRFYNMRRAALQGVESNAAHVALARLQREYPGTVTLITQNVDDLHERAGADSVIHMHGSLLRGKCTGCGAAFDWPGDMHTTSLCPGCGKPGGVRPDIVWFGEPLPMFDELCDAFIGAGVFVAIGTSGLVHPAAGFVELARAAGARTIEINAAETAVSPEFHERRTGLATAEVPVLVDQILSASAPG